jgi:hypothetical protein
VLTVKNSGFFSIPSLKIWGFFDSKFKDSGVAVARTIIGGGGGGGGGVVGGGGGGGGGCIFIYSRNSARRISFEIDCFYGMYCKVNI